MTAPSTWRTLGPRARGLGLARTDVLVFSAATAVLALHVAVDSFIAPEPGTAPGDHLLRGAASLAVLIIGAAVYGRLPAGGRAGLAAVLGVLALEGAALAVADARGVGARGEDWTGFLLCPSGVVLVGSAAIFSGARANRAGSATSVEPASWLRSRWPLTGSSSRSRSRFLLPIVRVRMSRPPSSGAPTRS